MRYIITKFRMSFSKAAGPECYKGMEYIGKCKDYRDCNEACKETGFKRGQCDKTIANSNLCGCIS